MGFLRYYPLIAYLLRVRDSRGRTLSPVLHYLRLRLPVGVANLFVSQSDMWCKRGCGKCIPNHSLSLAKHEGIECELIPRERRQILTQLLKEECERMQTQMEHAQKEKEKEFVSLEEELEQYVRESCNHTRFIDVAPCKGNCVPIDLELASFSDMKDQKKTYMSKPFYTDENGYKMCLVIYPNGYGAAEGKHVTVFASIMKGRNDSELEWPFCGILTIELLDQSKKEDHKRVTISYIDSESTYSSRVRIGTYSAATGKLWMIAHESLCDDGGPQYLSNDCMKFRVCKFENNKAVPERVNQMRFVLLNFLIFIVISITVHTFFIIYTHSLSQT